ncbi:hypothetical protein F511_45792 [Dorcoceras hygrometricum]|uniref:Uncharacterized protein n=1 Tax=Dorcoceras hygrometricum TaxID=472368 RepID=A0A2Z7A274_9LAMI|nr:hypothetical protein F511_45792 [Dorcoceras hygrometricum]
METLTSRAGRSTHAWWPDECDEDGRWGAQAYADAQTMMRRSFAQRWSRRLRHWSRALAARWLGGAASLVARKDVSWCPHRAPLMASAGRPMILAAAHRGLLQRLAFMRRVSHVDARWRAIAPRLVAAVREIRGGGGRRPAAAPASLRRCRDGWSEFF